MAEEITIRTGFWPFYRFRTFRGDCTVWHDVETGERPGTFIESRLSEIQWLKHQEERKAKPPLRTHTRYEIRQPDGVKVKQYSMKQVAYEDFEGLVGTYPMFLVEIKETVLMERYCGQACPPSPSH